MKNFIYKLIFVFTFLSVVVFPQNTQFSENEVIITLSSGMIDSSFSKTVLTFNDIGSSSNILKSAQLRSYLINNGIRNLELPSFIKMQSSFNNSKVYHGRTLKPIDNRITGKIEFSSKKNINNIINDLKKIEGVIDVSPNYIHYADAIPNDFFLNYHPGGSYGFNWGFYNWYQPQNDINMETAWNIQTGSPNIKVAVIDNGIDYTNPDLGSNYGSNYKVTGGYNFISPDLPPLPNPNEDAANHGTSVAGIIGGLNNNQNFGLNFPTGEDGGISGIAGGWSYNQNNGTGNMGVKLLAYRTPLTSYGDYLATWQARIDGANIINYSRSGQGTTLQETQVIWDAYELDGIPFCTSMGNTQDWQTSPDMIAYPAGLGDITLAVGAVNENFNRITFQNTGGAWESAYGSHIDLVAPGIDHYSTYLGNTFDSFGGTSESAPMVAGAAALIKSQNSNLKAKDIEQILKLTANDITNSSFLFNVIVL